MSLSSNAYGLSVLSEMYGAKHLAPMRTKAKIAFSEFVRPDGYWPQPYSLEQTFQVYRWLVRTGKDFSEYSRYGALDMLIGRGVMGSTDLHYEPILSLESLRYAFHRAVLGRSNGPLTNNWRKTNRIAFGEERILHFPHYEPFVGTLVAGEILSEAQISELLEAYLKAEGKLRVQLNPFHSGAMEIVALTISVRTYGNFEFGFELDYGYGGSSWRHELASGEQFLDTLTAALAEFERVSGQNLLEEVVRH